MTGLVALALALAGPARADDPDDPLGPVGVDARFSRGAEGPVPSTPWWTSLGDDTLDALVARALSDNDDLRAAWARVEQAGALATQSAAPLLPTLSASGSYSVTPSNVQWFTFGGTPPFPPPPGAEVADPVPSMRGTLDLRWTVDVFGRDALAWRAARYDREANEGDTEAAALGVSVRVAEAWYDLVLAVERRAVVEAQVATNRDLLEVVTLRYGGSEGTALDVLQQRQQLSSTEVQLPAARAAVDIAQQRLAVLLGDDPLTFSIGVDVRLPEPGAAPPVGTPADLVRHRPDLRAAAARSEAARRRKMSSQRALLPQLTATAQWGRQSSTFFTDTPQDGPVASAGASVSVPLFQGGRTLAGVSAASAADRAALAAWDQAVRLAVQDVETSLANDAAATEALVAQAAQLEAATLAFDEARQQYLSGLLPYLNVQTTLIARQGAELSMLAARRNTIGARIQLHEALAGPWTSSLRPGAP